MITIKSYTNLIIPLDFFNSIVVIHTYSIGILCSGYAERRRYASNGKRRYILSLPVFSKDFKTVADAA